MHRVVPVFDISMKHRIIAINLPQFHPFKENEEWWGKGFTEWTNVTKARPRFKGHYQPHLPSDTGFYDLRLPEARQMQADMGREVGIYGFCYYHYWFNGHQLMERPVNEILSSGKPDYPFMLCWANENWCRNWDGGFTDVLMEQHYSEVDDIEHMRWLCKNVFCDSRYIRVDNKPVFAIYRISLFPDIRHTVEVWRKVAREEFGMELYLVSADVPFDDYETDTSVYGFDASFDFQPIGAWRYINHKFSWLKRLVSWLPIVKKCDFIVKYVNSIPERFSYPAYVESQINKPDMAFKRFPGVSPGFDNSSRRKGHFFTCFVDCTPQCYGHWLQSVLAKFQPYSDDENFVFINAWNEWAEGNHLEPDQRWGRAYLDETKKVIGQQSE